MACCKPLPWLGRLEENHWFAFLLPSWSKSSVLLFGFSAYLHSEYSSSLKVRSASVYLWLPSCFPEGRARHRCTFAGKNKWMNGNPCGKNKWMNVSCLFCLLPLPHHLGFHEGISHFHVAWLHMPSPFVYQQTLFILQNSAHGFMKSFIQDRTGQDWHFLLCVPL